MKQQLFEMKLKDAMDELDKLLLIANGKQCGQLVQLGNGITKVAGERMTKIYLEEKRKGKVKPIGSKR